MPSFDIVSKVDTQEVRNAIDQAGREITTRFDFKDINAKFSLEDEQIVLTAPSDFQIQQMVEILRAKLSKRNVDVGALDYKPVDKQLHQARQEIAVKQGIDSKTAKEIVKMIKAEKFKVQATIQEDQVRVTGKKRDDLQQVIAYFRVKELD
ncbi:MAG: YajQ family cyclic di-GMP-binding protein, partial [Pseudomonadota bacterium]|nr:YajQ family cyclic di-GMP-binding protein [Pseudomonadota bacterium]